MRQRGHRGAAHPEQPAPDPAGRGPRAGAAEPLAPGPARPTVRLRLAIATAATALLAGGAALGMTAVLQVSGAAVTRSATMASASGPASAAPTPLPGRGETIIVGRAGTTGTTLPPTACRGLLGALPQRLRGPSPVQACQAALEAQAGPGGAARIRIALAQRSLDLAHFLAFGGLALAALAILSLGAGWWIAGRILRPLQVMTRRTQALSAQVPLGRIGLDGPRDELRDLADTIDGLLARLDGALESERRFVANASHELRTPLAIGNAVLDVALGDAGADASTLRKAAEQVRQVNARSERVIDGLLALARSQGGAARHEATDLATAARDAVDASAVEAERRAVAIRQDLAPAPVQGDPALLERLVANLVENGLRYNLQDGEGWVLVRTGVAGGLAALTVANSGPPLDPGEVSGLFEPFRRGGAERTAGNRGAGLGLSIVRAVVGAHDGTVTATARPDGGLEVRVELPARA